MAQQNPHRYLKRRAMSATMLTFTVFCCVSGGPMGLEPLFQQAGAGMGLLLVLITPIVWAMPDALTTAELASAIPAEGGYVIWVKRAMGPFAAFLSAWWTWLYALVDAALYPVFFVDYLDVILKTHFHYSGLGDNELFRWVVCLAMIAIFASINIRGTRIVGLTSSFFAIVLIAPFLLMFVLGAFQLIASPRPVIAEFVPPDKDAWGAIGAGLAVVMWNYLGWDTLSTIAEEVDDPGRAYPRAMLICMPLVMLVYLLPSAVGLAFYPDTGKWEEGAWTPIAQAVGGDALSWIVGIASLLSPAALFTASLLGSSRVPFVLAEHRFLPRALVDIHPRFGTPWRAILLSSIVYAILTLQTFRDLVTLNVIMYGSALLLEIAALIILRRTEPELPRPFRIPGGSLVLGLLFIFPAILVGVLAWSEINESGWEKQALTGFALISGPLIYLGVRWIRDGWRPGSGRALHKP